MESYFACIGRQVGFVVGGLLLGVVSWTYRRAGYNVGFAWAVRRRLVCELIAGCDFSFGFDTTGRIVCEQEGLSPRYSGCYGGCRSY